MQTITNIKRTSTLKKSLCPATIVQLLIINKNVLQPSYSQDDLENYDFENDLVYNRVENSNRKSTFFDENTGKDYEEADFLDNPPL